MRNILLLMYTCLVTNLTLGQLDDTHYLPPIKTSSTSTVLNLHRIYFSTPVSTPFDVYIYQGTNTTPIATISGLVIGAPKTFDPGNGQNNMTNINNSNTGVVLTNAGLRFVSSGGEKFFVNYRGRSNPQGASLTCKGKSALGNEFRWGGIWNRSEKIGQCNSILGIMSAQDGNVITISDYDPNCEFRLGSNAGGITSNSISITLNAGETFVLEAVTEQHIANKDGFLGAKIISTGPIAIVNGGLNFGVVPGTESRDAGIDQPVPTSLLGREHIFIRGNGTDQLEFPAIIGVQNNTDIYAAGNYIATINDGEYLEIPASNYSGTSAGSNMYVESSKEIYAYQCVAATSSRNTLGMNYIAPVNCLLPNSVCEIAYIDSLADLSNQMASVTIVAASTEPDSDLIITHGGGTITGLSSTPVPGTSDWKTFYVTGLTGQVKVDFTAPVAVGYFLSHGTNAGLAAYFSGFDTAPDITITETGTGCYTGATFNEVSGSFSSYQWYLDGQPVSAATTPTYIPGDIGYITLEVSDGLCTYNSSSFSLFHCNPEVQILKTDNVDPVLVGDTVIFTITAQNLGIDTITGLVVEESIPFGFTLLSVTVSSGTWVNPDWIVGTLTPGEIQEMTVTVTADLGTTGQTLINIVENTQDQTDTNVEPDDLEESVLVEATILPIQLSYFEASPLVGRNVLLVWETASEINNHYFQIERSTDLNNWTIVGTQIAVGYSQNVSTYNMTDYGINSKIIYYRLSQIDFNGALEELGIRAVDIGEMGGTQFNVFPNPAQNEISISGYFKGDQIEITDMLGKRLTNEVTVTNQSSNLIGIDISRLSSGIYTLYFENKSFLFVKN